MRIAVLEDDVHQRAQVVRALNQSLGLPEETITVVPFDKGEALRRALRLDTFDLLVLDWSVDDLDGIDLLRWLREYQKDNTPVLMLSAHGAERHVAEALDLGADDYVVKPFRLVELCARVRRLLTRRHPAAAGAGAMRAVPTQERFGPWTFDRSVLSVTLAQAEAAPVVLSDREFRMALALFRHIGKPVSRTYLLENASHRGEILSSRALDSHIYRLRTKLGLHPDNGVQLQTVYGQGYRLEWALPASESAR
jgi:DNA-binding response OmpR family regulator